METPNAPSLSHRLRDLGVDSDDLVRAFRGFNAYAEAFRKEGDSHA
jgi:hypothetical protein